MPSYEFRRAKDVGGEPVTRRTRLGQAKPWTEEEKKKFDEKKKEEEKEEEKEDYRDPGLDRFGNRTNPENLTHDGCQRTMESRHGTLKLSEERDRMGRPVYRNGLGVLFFLDCNGRLHHLTGNFA